MKHYLGVLTLFLACLPYLKSQSTAHERLTIEDGLSQGMIYDICQTRDGFLWIATKDGLNRYDGYNFKIFTNDPFNEFSLSENTVTALFEDSRGLLWAGTYSKGVNVYDRRTGRFHHFELHFGRNRNGESFDIYHIGEGPDGSIYLFQSGNGLVRIVLPAAWQGKLPGNSDLGDKVSITLFPLEQFAKPKTGGETILAALEVQPGGAVWVYTNSGPHQVELAQKTVKPVRQVPGYINGKPRNVWCTIPKGLLYFRDATPQVLTFPESLNIVRLTVKPAGEGAMWVSANQYLWHIAPGEKLDLAQPDWELDAGITAVTTDRNNNIWIGTLGYGLRKISPRRQFFHSGAAGVSIGGVWRDHQGRYYCKIINEIYPYDPKSRTVGKNRAFPNGPSRILDMHMDPSGAFWMLGRDTLDDGVTEIRYYHLQTGQSKSFPFPLYHSKNQTHAKPDSSRGLDFKLYMHARLLKTKQGRFCATGLKCLVGCLDTENGQYQYIDYSEVFADQADAVRAYAIAETGEGVLWIGTQQGLVKCSPGEQTYQLELLQASSGNPQGLNNNSIACLLPDPVYPSDVMWIGTKGGGINRLDLRSNTVEHITNQAGLPDNVVYGILPGSHGELWCSTNRGLARLQLDTARQITGIIAFTAAQGLQDNEFNTQAFSRAYNGELLFGGVNGLNHFFPEKVLPDLVAPPVWLVGLRINHRKAEYNKAGSPFTIPLEGVQALKLRHNQNNLSFEFAALDFTDPGKNRYRYRLDGIDKEWIETGTNRFAHFTHLAPGRYTLFVQGSNGEGAWHNIPHPVKITILPPWWLSPGAYAVYGILIALGVWQIHRFQLRRVQLREQLAFEHRETERIKALEQMKTNFFTNVTHEFRTPLTLILEPARRIKSQSDNPEITANAQRIEANSLRLLDLVNQLLDLAKLESGSMGLDLRKGDITMHLSQVYHAFLPLAEQRGVSLTFSAPDAVESIVFDPQKTELILNNLLSNALKFTPQGGQVHIAIDRYPQEGPVFSGIQISVSDTGMGIPPEELDKIFDRFYQANGAHNHSTEGTGIGLALSKELSGLLGGALEVQSRQEEGSVFTLRLPYIEPPAASLQKTPDNEGLGVRSMMPDQQPETEQPLVLIIEDNAELREFIKEAIACRWQVLEAANGEEGLAKALETLPDLVISDLMMPEKDGYAVCHELKQHELTAHIPVILLTAKSSSESKIKGLRTGADEYLTKPFSTEELLARMDNLVAIRRRLRQYWQGAQQNSPPPPDEHLSAQDREFLRRFTTLVEQYLSDERVGVEDFAREMHISRVQLHRKLKALTDQNISDFVRNYRLDRAMTMLRNREGLVYEIAYKVGFGSEKYFSRAFKEKFGKAPSQVA